MTHTVQTLILRHTSTLLFLMLTLPSLSQPKPEEILTQIKFSNENVHDSLYYELVKQYRGIDIIKAKKYAGIVNRLATKYKHPLMEVRSLYALAFFSKEQNKYDSALYYYRRGLVTSQQNDYQDRIVYFYNDLGSLYEIMDQYDSALVNYLKSMENAKQFNMPLDEAIAFNNIGLIFLRLENYPEAINYLEKAIRVKQENNILKGIEININNLALCYLETGKYVQGEKILLEVVERCESDPGVCDEENQLNTYLNLGDCYFRQGRYAESKIYLNKCISGTKDKNFPRIESSSLLLLGRIHCFENKQELCKDQTRLAVQIAEQAKLKRTMRDGYQQLSAFYESTGDLKTSMYYKNQYIAVKDSIFNEKMANNLRQIQVDAQRKEALAVINQKEDALKRSRMINILLALVACLFGLVLFFIYRVSNINRRMKHQLEIQVDKRTAELRRSNKELRRSHKEYDHLIYRTSHDIRGPLATLIGLTNLAKIEASNNINIEGPITDYLGKIERTAHGLNAVLSKLLLVNKVRNQPLHVSTVFLPLVIRNLVQKNASLDHFPLIKQHFDFSDTLKPVVTDSELLEIVLNTVIENAYLYYNANREDNYIRFTIDQTQDLTSINIYDNGIGIEQEARKHIFELFYVASERHGSGVGLFLAQSAAHRLDGSIQLISAKSPTHFKLVIPNILIVPDAEVEGNGSIEGGRLQKTA